VSKEAKKRAEKPEETPEAAAEGREDGETVEDIVEEPAKPERVIEKQPPAPAVPKVKKSRKVSSYYKVGEGLERLRPFCERCGPGYFMADHGDRYACGHCGFTRYKRLEKRDE